MRTLIRKIKDAVTGTDFMLLLFCIAASIFGVVMVYSATRPAMAEGETIPRDARAMVIAVGIGLVFALAVSFIDYNFITKLFPFVGAVCIGLMVLLFFIGVGPAERPDAKTWIKVPGTSFFFQPSELMKIGFIITFGMHLELVRDKLDRIFHLALLLVHAAVPAGLVLITGDMGSALVFIFISAVMLFCAGIKLRWFFLAGTILIAGAPFIWRFVFDSIQKDRILGLIYPDRYADVMLQQNRGMAAITGGGLTGQGLFHGALTQVDNMIPEAENDMIFTCIGEELGLIGCAAALGLILAVVLRTVHVGRRARMGGAGLMCFGFAAMIAFQTVVNVGMCLMLLPVVGITLPFFSAGGSSNLCVYIGIGLILSIYRFDREKEAVSFRIGNQTPFSSY
ncbi:MAG: FtsW/RodA/SpoVE family cell cycle protein [Clostridia bacterium]|nr:FtsW/RodA/SpoVE family cell cycle protein [Clostridia bacterium]